MKSFHFMSSNWKYSFRVKKKFEFNAGLLFLARKNTPFIFERTQVNPISTPVSPNNTLVSLINTPVSLIRVRVICIRQESHYSILYVQQSVSSLNLIKQGLKKFDSNFFILILTRPSNSNTKFQLELITPVDHRNTAALELGINH